jgi:alkylhydroperoxidase family enzyme
LDGGPLSLREREIVIDRTCALIGCEYEWGVHVAFFAGKADLRDEQVKATTAGGTGCWSAAEQALIGAVDALHFRMRWSDEEYRSLAAHYTEAQIFEILLLCGRYRTVSYIVNALDLPLDPRGARFPNERP